MKFAYADPPYLGTSSFGAEHHYGELHIDAAAFDSLGAHAELIDHLIRSFDGWALSLGSNTLHALLPLCPPDVRVGAWVKGWCSWKPGVHPKYAWEPVIYRGARKPVAGARATRDWVQCNVSTGQPVVGAKPEAFCLWIFDLLGMHPDDELVDLFPGSGAVGRAWEKRKGQLEFIACTDERRLIEDTFL